MIGRVDLPVRVAVSPGLPRPAPALTAAYWIAPWLICLAIHWRGFTAWFRADDFAWLGQALDINTFGDLMQALFAPAAQGTIRPWSERAFFIAGYALFGLNSLPYRLVIFGTMFADLALVASIGRRLSGTAAAGFWAAVFWAMNGTLLEPLSWACAYNQVMCGFFLLLALYLLMRYTETGGRRYQVWQWVVFLLGFGALELNVVYPALAAGYTWLCARKYFRGTLALVPVSIAYTAIHTMAAPIPQTGEYAMHYGLSMLHSLKQYWLWSLSSPYLESPTFEKSALRAGVYLVTAGLLAVLAFRRRDGRAWFSVLWCLVAIAPFLPLRDHLTEYYPCLPVIGLCWLGGWGFAKAWNTPTRPPRVAAVVLAALYAGLVMPHLIRGSQWNYRLTQRARRLVEGLAGAHQRHPNQGIMLYGVDGDLFWNVIRDAGYRLAGLDRVYVSAEDARKIAANPNLGDVDDFVLSGRATWLALGRDELVVYDVRGLRLRAITSAYAAMPRSLDLPLIVDAADPLLADLLGPEWYQIQGNHRWMPGRATLRMAGPLRTGQQLHLRGNCGQAQVAGGEVTITVTAGDRTLPPARVAATSFEIALALPDSLVGRPEMPVAITVDRTFVAPIEARVLGLAFGQIAVR